MRLTDRLNRPQRIVAVIAWGMALGAAGLYLTSLGSASGFGWYAYAPLAHSVAFPHTGLPGWARLIIWLALIALWALGSVWVLRPAPEAEGPTLP
jgi:heme/copper-type cytochrome/quinol oxidase subunit 1